MLSGSQSGTDVWDAYTYNLDTEKNLPWIDLTPTVSDVPDAPKPMYGVYQLQTSELKLALGTGGKRLVRPLEFVSDMEKKVVSIDFTRPEGKVPAATKK
jgi:uncharacterized protein (TIGR03067 family)